MKQAIEDIENHVVKNIRAVREVTKSSCCRCWYRYRRSVPNFLYSTDRSRWRTICKTLSEQFCCIFDLSQAAIRVFGYIMTCMKPKNDMIMFILEDCLEYTKYTSKGTVYRGLAELVKAEIIARGINENLWFINPLIVFNGDRVSFTKTYVRKNLYQLKESRRRWTPAIFRFQFRVTLHWVRAAVWSPPPWGTGGGINENST